jgi:hypothetical protein
MCVSPCSVFRCVVGEISHCTELYLIATVVKKVALVVKKRAEWSVSTEMMWRVGPKSY